MQPGLPRSIVFITGTFLSHACWDAWIGYFESRGYHCIAPPWPYKEAEAEELRNRPADDPIASNTIVSLTAHFASIVDRLPQKPILVGHSLGGLIVQLLLQMDLAMAGVAIHSFPPRGVSRFRISFLKAVWETMMLMTSGRQTYLMSFRKWKTTIANRMSCEQQKQAYYKYLIPESKKIIRDTFSCGTTIDFHKPHPPLLFTAGKKDALVPAFLNYRNYKKYTDTHSRTDYIEFQGHTHFVFQQPSMEREAACMLNWLQGLTPSYPPDFLPLNE